MAVEPALPPPAPLEFGVGLRGVPCGGDCPLAPADPLRRWGDGWKEWKVAAGLVNQLNPLAPLVDRRLAEGIAVPYLLTALPPVDTADG